MIRLLLIWHAKKSCCGNVKDGVIQQGNELDSSKVEKERDNLIYGR
jgi:hypothetical protein